MRISDRLQSFFGFILLILGLVFPLAIGAEDIVVVLSSDSPPYQEALAGVKEALARPLRVVNLAQSENVPPTRLILAIGGKAALHSYPRKSAIVYCLVPNVMLRPDQYSGPLVRVSLSPAPAVMLRNLKEIQPTLKRLGILWTSDAYVGYTAQLKAESPNFGVEVIAERLKTPENLLDGIRAIKDRVDALWLPPDPFLITAHNFAAFKQFSLSNHIPLYVPMDNLADQGAVAAVSSSFHNMGQKAGEVAEKILSGNPVTESSVYVEKVTLTINASFAAQSGLELPPAVLKKADRVIP